MFNELQDLIDREVEKRVRDVLTRALSELTSPRASAYSLPESYKPDPVRLPQPTTPEYFEDAELTHWEEIVLHEYFDNNVSLKDKAAWERRGIESQMKVFDEAKIKLCRWFSAHNRKYKLEYLEDSTVAAWIRKISEFGSVSEAYRYHCDNYDGCSLTTFQDKVLDAVASIWRQYRDLGLVSIDVWSGDDAKK